jgi:hypothetical protein
MHRGARIAGDRALEADTHLRVAAEVALRLDFGRFCLDFEEPGCVCRQSLDIELYAASPSCTETASSSGTRAYVVDVDPARSAAASAVPAASMRVHLMTTSRFQRVICSPERSPFVAVDRDTSFIEGAMA